MPFDPKAYLAQDSAAASPAAGGFDPKAYLSDSGPAAQSTDPSIMQTISDKVAQGGSLGFADELGGAISGAGRVVGVENLGGKIKDIKLADDGPTLDWDKIKDQYVKNRDSLRDLDKRAGEAHPYVSFGSELAGGLGIPIGETSTLGQAALKGAGIGAAAGVGNSESDDASGLAWDAGKGALTGAVVGGAAHSIGNAGTRLEDLAEQKAFKSAGGMLKDYRKAAAKAPGSGDVNDIGRFILDNGLSKAGDTFEDVGSKAAALRDSSGRDLGKGYDAAAEAINRMESMPQQIGQAGSNSGPSLTQKIAAAGFNPVRDKQAVLDKAAEELGSAYRGKQALSELSNYIDQLAEKHGDQTLNPKVANEIKSSLDDTAINWERNPQTREPDTETAVKALRGYLKDKISDHVSAIGDAIGNPDAAENLANLNKQYGTSAQIARMANDRGLRESANGFFGLRDTLAGGFGEALGHASKGDLGAAVGAATGAVGSKVSRLYGNAVSAQGADQASQFLQQFPKLNGALQKLGPGETDALMNRIGSKATTPLYGGNELDRDSSKSSLYKTPSQAPEDQSTSQSKFIQGN
jgi:hypothetical protein